MVMENVVEATVSIEPAMAPSRSRLPDSPTMVIRKPGAPRSEIPELLIDEDESLGEGDGYHTQERGEEPETLFKA
jgi:hypothetical protein